MTQVQDINKLAPTGLPSPDITAVEEMRVLRKSMEQGTKLHSSTSKVSFFENVLTFADNTSKRVARHI